MLWVFQHSVNQCGVVLGRFPGEHGVVAPGLSCQYPVKFAPDSLADYDDVIKVTVNVHVN